MNRVAIEKRLSILQINTSDGTGGAGKVAYNLHRVYRELGHTSGLAVGFRNSDDPNVFCIPNKICRHLWARFCLGVGERLSILDGHVLKMRKFRRMLAWMAEPKRQWEAHCGIEDFHLPGIYSLFNLFPHKVDIVHGHNLYRDYFDLRSLVWLTQKVPVVLTLHDAWLLSGHCAHSFDCERWKTGCGNCPDLNIYPAIRRDATAYNWRRKQEIYAQSQLYVAVPSLWLMQKVKQSILNPAILEARVIPNGVDLSIFHPADKQVARQALGLPQDIKVLLFTACFILKNPWKDYPTLRAAAIKVSQQLPGQDLLFIALGEEAPAERIGRIEFCFVPYQKDPEVVARYYQAADIYVHAARADTFPNTVIEALASGTPVVATAVGGIAEQIEDTVVGFLTPSGDANSLAMRIKQLLSNDELRRYMSIQSIELAQQRFDLRREAEEYLNWYQEILEKHEELMWSNL